MNRDVIQVLVASSVAQIAGFGKAVLITYYFGVGALLDGYYLAQAIPAMLNGILAGLFQIGFLPAYSVHLARQKTGEAHALLGSALALAAATGLTLSAALSFVAPSLVVMLTGLAESGSSSPAVLALRALSFLLFLNALVDCLGLALNAHRRFVLPAAAPIVNAVVSGAILVAAPQWGLTNLIAGTLVGVLCQLACVLCSAYFAGIRFARARRSQVLHILTVGAPLLPGLLMSNVSIFLPSVFAVRLGEGAVTALSLATRIHGAMTQVLGIAISTVLLSHFAEAVARGHIGRVAAVLRGGFPAVMALGTIFALWAAIAGDGLVALSFQRGAFDAGATEAVALAWLCMAVGLVPTIWGIALTKLLQAMQLGAVLSKVSALALVVLLAACAIGLLMESLPVIAFGTVLPYAATAAAMAATINKRLSLAGRRDRLPSGFAAFATVSVACFVMVLLAIRVTSDSMAILFTAMAFAAAVCIALWTR